MNRARRTWPEAALQRTTLEWLALEHPDLHEYTVHVPNQGTARRVRGAILRGQGAREGVLDLLTLCGRGRWRGLALELKTGRNEPTPEQREWIERLARAGWCAGWANSVETAREAFRRYAAAGPPR